MSVGALGVLSVGALVGAALRSYAKRRPYVHALEAIRSVLDTDDDEEALTSKEELRDILVEMAALTSDPNGFLSSCYQQQLYIIFLYCVGVCVCVRFFPGSHHHTCPTRGVVFQSLLTLISLPSFPGYQMIMPRK